MNEHTANHYWLGWFIVMFLAFLVPELYSLFTGHSEGTLSDTIWRLEGQQVPNGPLRWNAFHFLFIGELLLIDVWLLFHFGWRWFA